MWFGEIKRILPLKGGAMKLAIAILLVLIVVTFASADILSVKNSSVEIRDSSNPYIAQVVLVVPQNYPLRVVEEEGGYYKVSDFMGRKGWVNKADIAPRRTVVVKVRSVNIRKGPGTGHDLLFHANRGVAFKVLERKGKWLKVEHESRRIGWISRSLVWGNG
jgi:SH3-like domain-containing protein